MPAPMTARARARAEITREIKDEARRQLTAEGASALSLRAIARELGMVSSAIYRYFPSRDDLLTALIIDAYDAVGEAAERADAAAADGRVGDHTARWLAIGNSIRGWARENPAEYALVYGSPVPGYRAPQDTVAPASRVTFVLAHLLADAYAGRPHTPRAEPLAAEVAYDAQQIADAVMPEVPLNIVARALVAWTQLFGLISFELFGHLVGVVEDYDALFEHSLRITASLILP